jgi:myo-inositol catabolism protein IolH
MKIAFDPDVIRQKQAAKGEYSIKDMVYKIADMGYKYIEQSPHPQILPFYKYPKANKSIIKEYKDALKDTGLEISSLIAMYYWAGPDEERRKAAMRKWKRAIEIAVELNVDVINAELTCTHPNSPVVSEEKLYKSIYELLPILEKEGIRIELQAHPYDFVETNNETVDIVKSFDSDYVKYVYSVAHTFFYDDGKGDVESMLDYAGDSLSHVLLGDTYNHTIHTHYIQNPPDAKSTVHQHLGLGEGEVDFDALFAKLREMKFAESDENIITTCLFGFPEKLDQQGPETLERIKKELL